jgi:hypothetical protein
MLHFIFTVVGVLFVIALSVLLFSIGLTSIIHEIKFRKENEHKNYWSRQLLDAYYWVDYENPEAGFVCKYMSDRMSHNYGLNSGQFRQDLEAWKKNQTIDK